VAVTKFAENYYSFRKTDLIYGSVQYPRTPDQSVLAEIKGKLAQANSHYLARQYNDAIESYQQARSSHCWRQGRSSCRRRTSVRRQLR
jgi:hypothetical protein